MEQFSLWLFSARDLLTALVAVVTAVGVIYGWVVRPIKKQQQLDKEQSEKIDKLVIAVEALKKQVDENQAEYVRDRLQTLHERYCNELGWASAEEKRRVVDWYENYSKRGYNHLATTYAEDIMKLPEKPPVRE